MTCGLSCYFNVHLLYQLSYRGSVSGSELVAIGTTGEIYTPLAWLCQQFCPGFSGPTPLQGLAGDRVFDLACRPLALSAGCARMTALSSMPTTSGGDVIKRQRTGPAEGPGSVRRPSHGGFCCLLLSLLMVLSSGCAVSDHWQAALLLGDITSGAGPSRLKQTTPAPQLSTLDYAVDDRRYRADLYRPAGLVRAGLVLVPGAAEEGKDDPRLVGFATALARLGFAVLVPDLAGLRDLTVGARNIGEIADAIDYFTGPAALAPPGRSGVAALSYAAGPAVLAAARPETADQVAFVLSVGGYYSMAAVLTFITTGDFQLDGTWHHATPNPYGKWVFVQSNLPLLDSDADHRLFRRMIERKRADLAAPLDDLARQLSPAGRALYRFVTNTDRSRVSPLFAALPRAIRREVERLDLAGRDLTELEAELILVHGYDDAILPYSESVALARNLPENQVELYLIDGLMHVDAMPGLVGKWRMWQALADLLAYRLRP